MRLPSDATLLVIDPRPALEECAGGHRNSPGAEAAIGQLLAAWRAAGLPIIHSHIDRPRSPRVSEAGESGNDGRPEVAPSPGEPTFARPNGSAFDGTDLDDLLTELGRTTLVVCGFATDEAIEASVRHAADLGYRIFVVADACAAAERRPATAEEVHARSLARMKGKGAAIVETATACLATQTIRRWRAAARH
jgi:nicotinamidase-related amidase